MAVCRNILAESKHSLNYCCDWLDCKKGRYILKERVPRITKRLLNCLDQLNLGIQSDSLVCSSKLNLGHHSDSAVCNSKLNLPIVILSLN